MQQGENADENNTPNIIIKTAQKEEKDEPRVGTDVADRKKKKKKMRDTSVTKTGIFLENTPEAHKTFSFMNHSGLSPPDFSAIKNIQEDPEELPFRQVEVLHVVQPEASWMMSPLLNLNSPHVIHTSSQPVPTWPLAKKLNFND